MYTVDQVLELARYWPAFPVKTGTKAGQLLASWPRDASQDEATNRQRYELWPSANWAICTGHKFGEGFDFVLDVDDLAALAKLEADHSALPKTFTVKTPSGGRHLHFTSPQPIGNSTGALPKGIDIRGKGGYVLAPGSTVDGKPYEIADAADVAPAPQWLLDLIGRKAEPVEAKPPVEGVDQGAAEKWAEDYLQSLGAVSAGERNNTLNRAATLIRSRGLSYERAAPLLQAWGEAAGLTPEETAATIRSAYRSERIHEGSAAPEADFRPIPPAERTEWLEPASTKLPPFDPNNSRIGDVFTKPPAAPRFIVEGLLPVAVGQENAIGGAGKTTRRLWEALHLILGRPLYGRQVLRAGGVLVVTKEDGADVFRYRMHQVATAMGLSAADQKRIAEHFHVLDLTGDVAARLCCVDRAGNIQATDLAERICRGYRGEGLAQIGFDPWNAFSPGERFVNDAEAALMAAGALISRELACNVGFVGHVSKVAGRQGIIDAHSGRGGSAMGDNARFVLSYVAHDPRADKEWRAPSAAESAAARGDLFRLHVTKQSYAKRPVEPFWIERAGWSYVVHEGAPTSQEDALTVDGGRIKEFTRQELERSARYSARSLEDQCDRYGIGRNRARQVISWLMANGGLVEKPLPEAERHGRRTNYLEPVFIKSELPGSPAEIFT